MKIITDFNQCKIQCVHVSRSFISWPTFFKVVTPVHKQVTGTTVSSYLIHFTHFHCINCPNGGQNRSSQHSFPSSLSPHGVSNKRVIVWQCATRYCLVVAVQYVHFYHFTSEPIFQEICIITYNVHIQLLHEYVKFNIHIPGDRDIVYILANSLLFG